MAVLSKLDTEDQLVFLTSRKRLAETADLLNKGRSEGRGCAADETGTDCLLGCQAHC